MTADDFYKYDPKTDCDVISVAERERRKAEIQAMIDKEEKEQPEGYIIGEK
jgi:hypothetical protein